jgi:hypothetical protein
MKFKQFINFRQGNTIPLSEWIIDIGENNSGAIHIGINIIEVGTEVVNMIDIRLSIVSMSIRCTHIVSVVVNISLVSPSRINIDRLT